MKNLVLISLIFLGLIPACTATKQDDRQVSSANSISETSIVVASTITTPIKTNASANLIIPPEATITLAQYNKIKKGMSLVEVIRIFEDEGELVVTEYPLNDTRYWNGTDRSFEVRITFQNNKVISKTKIDLK
jgi:hypothetical protein